MRSKLEPAIWSCDTGQPIPCFDSCQLAITLMSNIKDKRCIQTQAVFARAGVRPPCCEVFIVVVVVVAQGVDHVKTVAQFSVTMHACGSVPIVMMLRLVVLRAAGASLLRLIQGKGNQRIYSVNFILLMQNFLTPTLYIFHSRYFGRHATAIFPTTYTLCPL